VIALLLAAVTPAWIVGTWLEERLGRDACASDEVIWYTGDGRTGDFWERGLWSLRGDRLTETITTTTDAGDPPRRKSRPAVYRYRVERLGPDRMRTWYKRYPPVVLMRCR
jgi:hypothetical protein